MPKHSLFGLLIAYLLLCIPAPTFGQENPSKYLVQSISKSALQSHVKYLSSDELMGRENGKKGQKLAAVYIMQQFKKAGIKPILGTYFQDVPFVEVNPEKIKFKINDHELQFIKDFEHHKNFDNISISKAKTVFVSYGRTKDLKKANDKYNLDNKVVFMVGGSDVESIFSINKRVQEAQEKGASAVVIIDDAGGFASDSTYLLEREQSLKKEFSHSIPVLFIGEHFADSLFKAEDFDFQKWSRKKLKKRKVRNLKATIEIDVKIVNRTQKGENVMAFIPGNERKSEIVILLAHYDHLGKKGNLIFNGADDNATGTAALIEIAKTLNLSQSKGNGFSRSVLVVLTTGEEHGLLGSRQYVKDPLFSLDQTFAVINVDMIGRTDEKHQNNPNYVYLIGSDFISPVLKNICESQSKGSTKIKLDYTYNSKKHPQRFYYRSDHYPFAKRNIPCAFYFSGTHKDYHESTDTFEKVDFKKVHLLTKLIFKTAWALLNTKQPLLAK